MPEQADCPRSPDGHHQPEVEQVVFGHLVEYCSPKTSDWYMPVTVTCPSTFTRGEQLMQLTLCRHCRVVFAITQEEARRWSGRKEDVECAIAGKS